MSLELFSDNLLQHMSIKREIRHQAFKFGILLTELPQLPQRAQPQSFLLSLPHVKPLLADSHRPTDLGYGCHALRVPQGGQDLFLGMSKSSCCHRRVLLPGGEDHVTGRFLMFPLAYFSGSGSSFYD